MKTILLSLCCLLLVATTIAQPTLSTTSTNVTCIGLCDGTIDLTITGGTPPYSYLWVGPAPYTAVVQDPNGLCSGIYNVTVTDGVAMTATTSVTISQPVALAAAITSTTNVLCNGTCTGTISATASGGTPAYTYLWNTVPPQNLCNAYNLCPGTYTVTIMDANACTSTATASVTVPPVLIVTISGTNTICPGATTTITASVTGGIPGYSYVWNVGATSPTINNATAGTYCITVTDANGCTGSQCLTITELPAVSSSFTYTGGQCNSIGNAINFTNTGSTGGGVNYSWTFAGGTPATSVTENPAGIVFNVAGAFDVTHTVTDGTCSSSTTETITVSSPISINHSVTNASCFGMCDGVVSITVTGGTPPYLNDIGTGSQISGTFIDICPGTYTVLVTDANSCTNSATVVVTAPPTLIVTISGTNTICPGTNTSIVASVTGGAGGYTYFWSNGSTLPHIPNATAGTWCVTITDANGCTGSQCVTITESPAISLTITSTPQSCHNSCDATATAIVSGGVPPFCYLWSNVATTHHITGLCSGHYELTVVDANGCTASDSVFISNPPYAQIIGTLDNSNGPIAAGDAIVTLYNSQWDSLGSFAYNGLFHFPNLCPGDYYLFAELTNNAPYPLTVNSYYDSTISWVNADAIHLLSGDSTNVVFTLAETTIFAPGPGQISGNVSYGSYTGSKTPGEPIEGAEITVEQDPGSVALAQDITDAAGNYLFENLPTGDQYKLLVSIPGIPMVFTWDNISINTTVTNFDNLNFIVDTLLNGIYTDSTMTALDKNNSGSIEVYPNPFSDDLTINFRDPQNRIFIGLFDVTGKCVYENTLGSENSMTIPLPQLNPGMYYLKMTSGNTMFIKKLVKRY